MATWRTHSDDPTTSWAALGDPSTSWSALASPAQQVNAEATIASVSPNTGTIPASGTNTVYITILGNEFEASSTLDGSAPGITSSLLAVISDTEITASIAIESTADARSISLSVTNTLGSGAGTPGGNTFTTTA